MPTASVGRMKYYPQLAAEIRRRILADKGRGMQFLEKYRRKDPQFERWLERNAQDLLSREHAPRNEAVV